ncbi:ankyrin repeat containing protein [Coccidioides posadasii C735 delta SOWgp]|uniref:Ankyrin repeat containing protein n=1 Tax=Coccidioides posadasii (strain C735) TaxID=222929 RepID=C5PAC9_COCP7|nr:ankyrin repeat containing protein [Coccidioides posadasii C735 delta SOWgp]EER26691.1 ankyrin repeat containing protein [Coccidioides posadasii C735 delta SOWgp]|eukprot:XP_003068836.1 ankyrin repeat containing protein [Coccidioides posadasii C735 delta SOWgp]
MNNQAFSSRKRLEELAASVGVSMSNYLPILNRNAIFSFSHQDKEAAESLATRKRLETFSSKSHIFRRTPSQRNFKKQELYVAIETVIRENGPVGVLECLLTQAKDAKSKKNIFKTDTQEFHVGPLLELAIGHRRADMVSILAPQADPASVNSCLRCATASANLDCVKALLENGADPNSCQEEFIENITSGNIPLVKLLLRAEKRLKISCLDEALPIMVSKGPLQLVIILLQQGANADSAGLFESVVEGGRIDLIAAFVSAKRPPSRASLSRALGVVLRGSTVVTEEQRLIIEMLLCAGASGENVNKILMRSISTNDRNLASTVVSYREVISYDPSDAIIEAVKKNDMEILSIIFNGKLDSDCASALLAKFSKVSVTLASSRKLWIVSTLVKYGATGVPLHEYLVNSVQRNDELLVRFLVDHGASVDYQDAKALRLAMSSKNLQIFKKLLGGKPSQPSFSLCFRLLPTLPPNLQLDLASELLAAGAQGQEVDKTLARVFSDNVTLERHQFLELLVRHGADVNIKDGYCFQEAARLGDIVSLSTLLKGSLSELSLCRALTPASKLSPKELRFTIVDLLLSAGARGPMVDAQLVELVQEIPVDIVLISLVLEKGEANINTDGGKAVHHACRKADHKLLELLLQYRPTTKTLDAAFLTATSLEDPAVRYEICHKLLNAGVKGAMLDASLICEQQSPSSNMSLLELLLDHGANINFNNGAAIRNAIKQSDEQQLVLLASRMPSRQTVIGGLELLLRTNTVKRYEMANILLNATDISVSEALNPMLPEVIRLDIWNHRLLKLFIQHGASVDYQQGMAIRKSIDNDYIDACELLLGQPVSSDTLETVFGSCLAIEGPRRVQYAKLVLQAGFHGRCVDEALLKIVQEKPCDMDMVILLLGHGASVHFANSQCIVHAALSRDDLILRLLLESVSDKIAVTYAFGKTISAGITWLSASGLPTIELLLRHGATGEALNLALIAAVENAAMNPEVAKFVDLFLEFGARADYHDGRALRAAISKGQISLTKKIMDTCPSSKSLAIGLTCVFSSDLSEDVSLKLIEILTQNQADVDAMGTLWCSDGLQKESPVLLCLQKWPRGTKILEKLLQSGMNVNQITSYTIENDHGLEHVSLLLWALLQPQQRISSYAIECLLKHGADPNFQSTGSWKSPLLIASIERAPDVVLQLIRHGADVSRGDAAGKSPLFYASRRNQIDIIRHLIDAGATVDDGSLHEAAQALSPDAVQLLISYGHDPNFPSMLHDGRGALANLSLHASDARLPVSGIRKTIDALIAGKADLRAQSQGKSLLFHALDNPGSCVHVTTALLASGMWKLVNDSCNIFTSNNYVYSPSMYIKKNLQNSPRELGPQLLHILKAHNCRDVYYRLTSPQPSDMVNGPPEIMAEESRRQARVKRLQDQEEEHQMQLRQNEDLANQQDILMTRTHNLRIQHDRELADEREANAERFAKQQLRLDAESAAQRSRLAQQNRMLEFEHTKTLSQLRLQALEQHARLQIANAQEVAHIEQELVDKKLATEIQRIRELEAANDRQYKRDSDILCRQQRLWAERKGIMSEDRGITPGNASGTMSPVKGLTYQGAELD